MPFYLFNKYLQFWHFSCTCPFLVAVPLEHTIVKLPRPEVFPMCPADPWGCCCRPVSSSSTASWVRKHWRSDTHHNSFPACPFRNQLLNSASAPAPGCRHSLGLQCLIWWALTPPWDVGTSGRLYSFFIAPGTQYSVHIFSFRFQHYLDSSGVRVSCWIWGVWVQNEDLAVTKELKHCKLLKCVNWKVIFLLFSFCLVERNATRIHFLFIIWAL